LGMAIDVAIELIDSSIAERWSRLAQFVGTGSLPAPRLPSIACPMTIAPGSISHLEWVKTLTDEVADAGTAWLQGIVSAFVADNQI
jgi:hypothetical protein